MQIDIKLHKNDLPDEIKLDDKKSLAIDSEFSGLNVNRDKLYLVQISSGNNEFKLYMFPLKVALYILL